MLCRFERSIFKSADGYCVFSYNTKDSAVPEAARNNRYFRDRLTHITAVGYHLPATDAVEVNLTGDWTPSKYGLQLSVQNCEEVVPKDKAGLIAYLSSGLIKGIG